ncbi:hypothetical protein [Paenibacillus thalictri]|uniref:Uncharacterized protein n=1 Tax=Paenibacillus thalictri TaxID=2527873 RepID=A0A4Q9DDW3_9BACL|nr:hypothetical protein [Paenibacillus thalictri]TBL69403.1 hypothetical protein EYB31_36050 [Paenibacillus thalictri]
MMPRKMSIYFGMVGALCFSIAHLMKWYSSTILSNSKIYVDGIVEFATYVNVYYSVVLGAALLLLTFFFINFSFEMNPSKIRNQMRSTLRPDQQFHSQPNVYSSIFKSIGAITIIIGLFIAIYIWSDGIKLPKDQTSVFLFGLAPFLYCLVGGLTFMGFGEVIKLIQQIRDKNESA